MPTTTTTYSFNKPVVGADEDDWGGYLNGNWDSVDDLLDGTTPVTGIDINSGTLDGVTIGGTTAGAGTFTTLTANTSITGTLATAAQPNITSVGSLTSLDVAGTLTSDGLTVDATTSTAVQANADAGYSLFNGATNSSGARINISGASAANGIAINGYNAAQNGYTPLNYLAADHRFKIGSSEQMRLDSSGNLLVGKTSAGASSVGFEARANGFNAFTRDGGQPLEVRRLTSDGVLIDLRKDSTTVGSIGSVLGVDLFIAGNRGAGQRYLQSNILPCNASGTINDNTLDLGSSSNRYKDLYLSGIAYANYVGSSGDTDTIIAFDTANTVRVVTAGSEAMRIESSGRVGIGTSSPSATLTISQSANNIFAVERTGVGSGSGQFGINIESNSQTTMSYDDGAPLVIGTASNPSTHVGFSERMRIDSSGNVGIGTGASPSRKLTIYDSSLPAIALQTPTSGSANSDGFQIQANSTDVYLWNYENTPIRFGTNGSEAMRINGAQRVLVNRTTDNHGGMFCLNYTGGSTAGLVITDTSSSGTGVILQVVKHDNTIIGSITHNQSSTSFNTSSDYRLKENVVDLTGATTRLKQLEPKRFNFIADADTTVDGFLAHEVQSVVPEAITGTHNEVDADGNPVYQGIDQSKLVPLLVATIKELEARITALENA